VLESSECGNSGQFFIIAWCEDVWIVSPGRLVCAIAHDKADGIILSTSPDSRIKKPNRDATQVVFLTLKGELGMAGQ
jgi:hypothetical protein